MKAQESTDPGIRINKYIADAGVCSRRSADALIVSGRVRINDHPAGTGERVNPGDRVFVDEKEIRPVEEKVYLLLNKPAGITCTADRNDPSNVIDHLHYPLRITYCGRLDKDSEGLLLLTNDGDIINQMMKASNFHEKEYVVTVDRKVTPGFLRQLEKGVWLEELDTTTRPCRAWAQEDPYTFRIVLTQGLNRQIRRMCEAIGFHVRRLKRVRIMNLKIGNLKSGEMRPVSEKELKKLKELLVGSHK